ALTAADSVHSGLVIDGVPFEGAHGLAGAAAWLALNPVEREDYRRFGSLEAEIGAAGIVRRLVWRIKSGDRSRVLDMAGGDIVLPDRILTDASLIIDQGRIAAIDTTRGTPAGASVVNVQESYVVPGFVDVHVHGVEGHDTLDGAGSIEAIASRLPRCGVT